MMENAEIFGVDTISRLPELLKKPHDLVVVDVGSGNYISTLVEKGTLLILIGPNLDPANLDWGDNYQDEGGEVLALPMRVEDVGDFLSNKADRIQMIAPDPDEALTMLDSSLPMLKKGGEAVLIFDIVSNKKEKVDGAIAAIKEEYSRLRSRTFEPNELDPDEAVEGTINSGIISGSGKVLILRK